jgi:hypothetical protein
MATPDRALLKVMWERWRPSIVLPDTINTKGADALVPGKKSYFLGYFDMEFVDDQGFRFRVRGLEAKVLSGSMYVDMPSEQSDIDDPQRPGKKKWFPHCFPATAETRDLLTNLAFRDPTLLLAATNAAAAWVAAPAAEPAAGAGTAAAAAAAAAPAGATSPDNPF